MHPSIHARHSPHKTAYRMSDSGLAVSYRQLEDGSNRLAQLFRRLGLGVGDRGGKRGGCGRCAKGHEEGRQGRRRAITGTAPGQQTTQFIQGVCI